MNPETLDLSFSTCPNDTFIFYAMVHGKSQPTHSYTPYLADVEVLNRRVLEQIPIISKISFGILPAIQQHYTLLDCGGALGFNNGPLLIAGNPVDLSNPQLHIAIPGIHTTANKLLTHFFPHLTHKTEMLFSDIEEAVLSGKADAGLIIHESRFTYQQKGLICLADMGKLWNDRYRLPLPLGAIVIRNDYIQLKEVVENDIRQSLHYAYHHPQEVMSYVRQYAGEMDEQVMKQHIDLYVNEYSRQMGAEGYQAVQLLASI